MTIGVLALQGGFDPHLRALEKLSLAPQGMDPRGQAIGEVATRKVLYPRDLDGLDGLILPGGESTTIGKMMARFGFFDAILESHAKGLAIFGTCAGLILLAKEIRHHDQVHLGLLDIEVERNAYGPQVESFESSVQWWDGRSTPAVFIRAPIIRRLGKTIQVLAEQEGVPVLIQQGKILAASFHPELTTDLSVHRYFVRLCSEGSQETPPSSSGPLP